MRVDPTRAKRVQRTGNVSVRTMLAWLGVFAALGCGSSSRSSAIQITAPEKGSVLTSADDLDDDMPGLQYTVTASSSGIAAGTEVLLEVEDEAQATLSKVGRNGDIVFERVTLPSGTHSLTVSTKAGNVRSPSDWDYTYKAAVIDNPRDGGLIGYLEDEDKDQSNGIQIMVSVSTYGIALSDDVKLQVDGQDVGTAQHPNANGKLAFHEVPLSGGDHTLLVTAGSIESKPVKVTVAWTCATATFVSPEPPGDGAELVLGGGDMCPMSGEQFKANFTVATDVGENRSVDLIVNDMIVATERVKDSVVKFSDIVLDRYKTLNQVAVQPESAQGVTCKPIAYPVGIRLDCEGVDCSIDAPKPQSGVDATGKSVLYLNGSSAGKDGFDFEVLTESGAVGQAAKLVIDSDMGGALNADPKDDDSRVVARFEGVKLSEGTHSIQAVCEDKMGRQGLSRMVSWVVDTKACNVDIREPSTGASIGNAQDAEPTRSGIQVTVQSKIDADDCVLARAAPCDESKGIDSDVGFESFGGGTDLTSSVTLLDESMQTLCVEVKDRAGNVGLGSVDVKYSDASASDDASKPLIESPKDGDSYNAKGSSKHKADSDPKSADCNANFDVACAALNVDVQLRRDNGQGSVLATAKCQAKAEGDAALPKGYQGRARFKNVAFLASGAESAKIVATQVVGSGPAKVSALVTVKGDCQGPALEFTSDMGDPCQGGQIGVAGANDSVTKRVVATDTTNDSSSATLTLSTGGTVVTTKNAAADDGAYTFDDVAFGSPGDSGKRSVTLKVTAKDAFDNEGERACDTNIVFDVPTLTVSAPADNVTLTPSASGLCMLTGSSTPGVTVTATADRATERSASAHFDQGADVPLTMTGTAISGCVPVQNGTHKLVIRLTSTKTTAKAEVTRTVIGKDLVVGLSITEVTQPADNRKGSLHIGWTAPNAGQFTGYQLRCAPTALDVATASAADANAWWTGARVQTLPDGFEPPSNAVDLHVRVGESNQCVLRGVGSDDALSPLVSSTDLTVPFHNHRFAPTSTGQMAGQDFAGVGDVNGDGIDDLLVGGQGEAYLVFGSRSGWSNGTPDVVFKGPSPSYFGNVVAAIGDFNDDGRNDFALSDFTWASRAGRVLVYYGRASDDAWPSSVDDTTSCNADLCFVSDVAAEQFGYSIASAGDFDDDGRPDLFAGAPAGPGVGFGSVYVIASRDYTSGSRSGSFFGTSVTVDSGAHGFVVKGSAATVLFGIAGTTVGKFDSSAGSDLVVTAFGCRSPDCVNRYMLTDAEVMGKAYFFSGRAYPSGQSGLVSLGVGDLGFRDMAGTPSGMPFVEADAGRYGAAVYALGNVYDLPSANQPGKVDVAVWRQNDLGFEIYLGDTNFASADRLRVEVASAQTSSFSVGNGLAHADLDGDGISELCAAGEVATRSDPARLWYGDVIKSKLADKTLAARTGSALNPDLSTGGIIEFVGDLNGDGTPDLAVGAPTINPDASMYGQGEFQILY